MHHCQDSFPRPQSQCGLDVSLATMNSKGIYFGIFSNVLGNLLMLGATLWLTRLLDPVQFGQFRVGSNFALLMLPFLALGGERLVSRLIQRHISDPLPVARALATVFVVAGTGVVLLAIGYQHLSSFVFAGNLPSSVYYASIAIIPLTIAYNLGNTIWRHVGDPATAQIDLNFIQRLVRAPLLIGSALLWPGALAASLAMTAAQAISLYRIRGNLQRFPVRDIGSLAAAIRSNLGEMLLIGVPVAIMAAADRLDVLLVNAVMGVECAGSYDLIYMLSLTAMFPAMALSKTTEPFLYGLSGDAVKQQRLKQLQTRAFLLSCAAVAGISVVAPVLSSHLGNAGPDFARATLVLSAGLGFSSVHGPVIEYLQINGKSRLTLGAVLALLLGFFALKYLVASTGSLTSVAALAGLFYFTLRLVLALYIRIVHSISMAHPWVVMLSTISYTLINTYIFLLQS